MNKFKKGDKIIPIKEALEGVKICNNTVYTVVGYHKTVKELLYLDPPTSHGAIHENWFKIATKLEQVLA